MLELGWTGTLPLALAASVMWSAEHLRCRPARLRGTAGCVYPTDLFSADVALPLCFVFSVLQKLSISFFF